MRPRQGAQASTQRLGHFLWILRAAGGHRDEAVGDREQVLDPVVQLPGDLQPSLVARAPLGDVSDDPCRAGWPAASMIQVPPRTAPHLEPARTIPIHDAKFDLEIRLGRRFQTRPDLRSILVVYPSEKVVDGHAPAI